MLSGEVAEHIPHGPPAARGGTAPGLVGHLLDDIGDRARSLGQQLDLGALVQGGPLCRTGPYSGGMSPDLDVPIGDESIRLGQLLKLGGLVQDGVMARSVIENGEVTVDGEVVRRRGTQIRPGMIVAYADQSLRVTRPD